MLVNSPSLINGIHKVSVASKKKNYCTNIGELLAIGTAFVGKLNYYCYLITLFVVDLKDKPISCSLLSTSRLIFLGK